MVPGFSKTPRYVLKDGSYPTSAVGLGDAEEPHSKIIFGFSDKPEYDEFLSASARALTPYPLVKGYLQNQIATEAESLMLIVIDASGPKRTPLLAATMQSVLHSFATNSELVPISYQLDFDEALQGYHVQKSLEMLRSQ